MHAPPFVPTEANAELTTACPAVNLSRSERKLSMLGGGALLLNALLGPRRSRPLSALLGGALLYRGLTGHCHAYEALGVDTSDFDSPRE